MGDTDINRVLCSGRLGRVWGFGVDQWLRERDLLRLCGFSGAARQHQGTTQSHPTGRGSTCGATAEPQTYNKKLKVTKHDMYLYFFIGFCSQLPAVKSNGFHNGHVLESSTVQSHQLDGWLKVRQVGAGQGGEGAEDGKGQGPNRRSRDAGREGLYHNWRNRKLIQKLNI